MPSHYQYQCLACGKVETRYRNARLSRCCRAAVTRLEGKPIDWEGHVANLQAEVDRLRTKNSNLAVSVALTPGGTMTEDELQTIRGLCDRYDDEDLDELCLETVPALCAENEWLREVLASIAMREYARDNG